MTGLTVIVPVLDEAPLVGRMLAQRARLGDDVEVMFVDGGSGDGTDERLRAGGARVISAARGRAAQMNAGARLARGDILLFLHADTELPPGAAAAVVAALASGRHVWGRFDVRIAGRARLLRVVAALMNLRSRLTGIATGDQAVFVDRAEFTAVGGFPDQPLMEDIELSRRLLGRSRPACLRARVTTSGRRWESRGVLRTILLMWRLRLLYWLGGDPGAMAERYR
jgi:rSAM/selenodomain-associated transferase 2